MSFAEPDLCPAGVKLGHFEEWPSCNKWDGIVKHSEGPFKGKCAAKLYSNTSEHWGKLF